MAYLEFAEIQALERKPMYMSDWITKLDDFLKLSGRKLLTHTGKISHEQALTRAQLEYEKYRTLLINQPSEVEAHFDEAVRKMLKPGPKEGGMCENRQNTRGHIKLDEKMEVSDGDRLELKTPHENAKARSFRCAGVPG